MKPKQSLILCAFSLAMMGPSPAQQAEKDIQATLPEDLGRTYGYVAGQRLKVEKIAARFPQLASEANRAQMQWDSVFASAAENLEPQLQKLLKGQWPEVQEKMESQIESIITAPPSSEQARQFIQEVQSRAKGKMESPILETLLTYHPAFLQKPAAEFSQGFKTIFKSDGSGKAKGLKFSFEVPASWKAREGQRPNIIKVFTSENGRGLVSAMVMVRDLAQEFKGQVSEAEINALRRGEGSKELADEMFSDSSLKEMAAGAGVENVRESSSRRMVLDGNPGAMVDFVGEKKRLDLTLTMFNRDVFVIYNNYLLVLTCQVGKPPTESESDFKKRVESYQPLFQLMANSVVIQSQY